MTSPAPRAARALDAARASSFRQPEDAGPVGEPARYVPVGGFIGRPEDGPSPARPAALGMARLRRDPTIRRVTGKELQERGARIAELGKTAPEAGINLWVAHLPHPDVSIFLLGTEHGLRLTQMAFWPEVVRFLRTEEFTHVFSETTGRHDDRALAIPDDVVKRLEEKQQAVRDLAQLPADASTREQFRLRNKITNADSMTGGVDDIGLDDAYVGLALTGSGRKPGLRGVLDTDETRGQASEQNRRDGVFEASSHAQHSRKPDHNDRSVPMGNQRAIFEADARDKLAGLDIAAAEERNKQWMERLGGGPRSGDRQLWIVGATHLPGLIVRFIDLGWKVTHQGL